jgi:hypothetical protein
MNQAWPVTLKILGEYQRDQQVDQQRDGNQPAQDIRPRHFFFSSAAQPATKPSVSNKKAMIAAVYTRSMSTPRIAMRATPRGKDSLRESNGLRGKTGQNLPLAV